LGPKIAGPPGLAGHFTDGTRDLFSLFFFVLNTLFWRFVPGTRRFWRPFLGPFLDITFCDFSHFSFET